MTNEMTKKKMTNEYISLYLPKGISSQVLIVHPLAGTVLVAAAPDSNLSTVFSNVIN
jgi:hypothetical protein